MAGCAAVAAANWWILHSTRHHRFRRPDDLPVCEAGVVPGTSEWTVAGEVRNPHFDARIAAAATAFEHGAVDRIVVSGGPAEVAEMTAALVRSGVPLSAVLGDSEGVSTAATIASARRLGLQRVVLIGESFHMPRAVFVARNGGLEAVAFEVPRTKSYAAIARECVQYGVVPAGVREVAARARAAQLQLFGSR